VIERYRLIDYEAAKEGFERDIKENMHFGPPPNYKGKYLQLEFTVEDAGVFTTPWTATLTYAPANGGGEVICAENRHEYYNNKESDVPKADKPDF